VWSRPLDVHKWSDHQSTNDAVGQVCREIEALRRSTDGRIRDRVEIRKHVRVLLLDLYIAANERAPGARNHFPRWIGIARGRDAYQRQISRYSRLFLSFRHLTRVVNDLIALGYVKQAIGFHDRRTGIGRNTRIRARSKLLRLMDQHHVTREAVQTQPHEAVILRNADGNAIDYEDTEETNRWRANLDRINKRLAGLRIRLHITDDEFRRLNARMANDPERGAVDYRQNQLKRVFNNGSFREGGRFYGGWWQNVPKEYRKYLDINHKGTVEVDYSGLHIRMLYALAGENPPDDPYDLPGINRDQQKEAVLVMINANSEEQAVRGLRRSFPTDSIEGILRQLADRHREIARYFYTGEGVRLQFRDSCIAEKVMLRMLDIGREVLPVHDSFIMRIGVEHELVDAMAVAFEEEFPEAPAITKFKETALEEAARQRREREERTTETEPDFDERTLTEILSNYDEYQRP